jgi:hypothetical protein
MENPRNDDNLGMMACFHGRYLLGDDLHKHNIWQSEYKSWSEMEDHIRLELKALVILPLYLYDHGGLRMKVGSFQGLLPQGHAEFDSGQVGFIYATKADIKKNYPGKQIRARLLAEVEATLRREVAEYDHYLTSGEED